MYIHIQIFKTNKEVKNINNLYIYRKEKSYDLIKDKVKQTGV